MPFIKDIGVRKSKTVATSSAAVICKVAGGQCYSLAIEPDGRAWAWGLNTFGQLGDNSTSAKLTPVSVFGAATKTFCEISVYCHSVAIDKNGKAWGWGLNSAGQLGDNSVSQRQTPVSVGGTVKTFCKIHAGAACHTVAIDKNGRVWAWGLNNFGQLGDNTLVSKRTPVSVVGTVKTFCQIAASDNHNIAIDKNGRIWAWGNNNFGQLGDNSITSRLTPVSILGTLKTFCQITTGGFTSCSSHGLDKNGRAWSWGLNNVGQLGDNDALNTSRRTPVSVAGAVKTFCKITGQGVFVMAIDKNGRAWGWGDNSRGQLGNDSGVSSTKTPVSVAGTVKTFCEISAGNRHVVAVDNNGYVWAWGSTFSGALGNSMEGQSKLSPVILACNPGLGFACQITAAGCTGFVVDASGYVYSWGNNVNGLLGQNLDNLIYIVTQSPKSIYGTKTFCNIASGGAMALTSIHFAAIDMYGKVWSWGLNNVGQLGDNSITSRLTPVSVGGTVKTFCQISVGASHTTAIDKNGRIWAWGNNSDGQLGINGLTSRRTPVSVLGAIKTFCQIAAGSCHNLALDYNGKAWSWGDNSFGKLGDATIVDRCTPIAVVTLPKTFCKISASINHSLAIDKNGNGWGWGGNAVGQIGDNTTLSRRTPVTIKMPVATTFCQITAGASHSLAIDSTGKVWGWGFNNSGQLGNGNTSSTLAPAQLAGTAKTFCQISAGACHSLAIDYQGKLWSWGNNVFGQLGDNNLWKATPIRVCTI